MGETPFPAIDYTSRDYASIRQSMIDGIATRLPEWTSRSPNDFGIVLIELFAHMGDILSYYADRIANEAFLPTATQRSSVLHHAALLNYRPRGTVPSHVTLRFTVSDDMDATIPAGTVVRSASSAGETPLAFETDADIVVEPEVDRDPAWVEITATQGESIGGSEGEEIGTSDGSQNQSFILSETPVIEDSVTIRVQEGGGSAFSWTTVNNIIDARPEDNVFATSLDADGVLTIIFGDGVNGRIPPNGATISAFYRVGGGAAGNLAAGLITDLATPIVGVLSVTNATAATGGADVESIASIRTNAPYALRTLNRAVTAEDFAALALQVPSVAKARADSSVYTNVIIYVAPFGGGTPSASMLNDVVTYFADKKLIGVDVIAGGPIYAAVDINVIVAVRSTYSASQVRTAVDAALRALLAFDSVDFGQRVTISDVYTAITDVPGVAYAVVSQLGRRGDVGVADVVLEEHEIPIAGTFNVSTTGGINTNDPTNAGSAGSISMPTAASAPEVYISRCDSPSTPMLGTMHLAVRWNPGPSSNVSWFLEIDYLDAVGDVLDTNIYGAITVWDGYEIDIPKNPLATSLRLRTQAYQGATGPAYSPYTIIANPCS